MDIKDYVLPPKTLLVIKHNGRWDGYGHNTVHGQFLLNLLKHTGGVSETVPDGYYEFTARPRGLKMDINLSPLHFD